MVESTRTKQRRVGFTGIFYSGRVFCQATGLSPREYQEGARDGA